MKRDWELKIMGHLDGELSHREAVDVAALIDKDPQARALWTELQHTRAALTGNEPQATLPESREFYWSKIERAIRQAGPASQSVAWTDVVAWWQRRWVQWVTAGTVAVALGLLVLQLNGPSGRLWGEVDNPLAETGTFTFRSESERMTVVWIYDRPGPRDSNEDEGNTPVDEVM